MSNSWQKYGLLYCPPEVGCHPKLASHAANPLAVFMEDDTYRIFFSGRDKDNRSSVGAVDVDIVKREVVREHHAPFFNHGPEGSFYAAGVSIGNCYAVGGKKYMLFMGWQAPKNGHWRGDIGRLTVKPDLTLELENDTPFMGSDDIDPISLSYPWVVEKRNGTFAMWYGSTIAWDAGNNEMLHVINSASSEDGHHWCRDGVAVPFEVGVAQAFSRPTVAVNKDGKHEMWFSYRSGGGDKYKIGYAVCDDGKGWKLALDKDGIHPSREGWDSEMIEYPFVFDHKGVRYLLYNGNGHGKSGFGLAVLSRD